MLGRLHLNFSIGTGGLIGGPTTGRATNIEPTSQKSPAKDFQVLSTPGTTALLVLCACLGDQIAREFDEMHNCRRFRENGQIARLANYARFLIGAPSSLSPSLLGHGYMNGFGRLCFECILGIETMLVFSLIDPYLIFATSATLVLGMPWSRALTSEPFLQGSRQVSLRIYLCSFSTPYDLVKDTIRIQQFPYHVSTGH